MSFTVILTVQSPGNDPVDITYATGVSPAYASSVVCSVLADTETPDFAVPESVRPKFVSVRVVES